MNINGTNFIAFRPVDIKTRHAAFVSNQVGGSIGDVALACSLFCACVLLRNLSLPWFFPARNWNNGKLSDAALKFVLDFVIIIAPLILGYTVLWDSVALLYLLIVTACSALILLSAFEYCWLYRDKQPFAGALDEIVHNPRPVFITYFRTLTLIISSIVILAVDFPLFPRRLAKTETFGYSLMDFGVGGFCIINGFTAPEMRNPLQYSSDKLTLRARLKPTWPLVIIGVARTAAVKLFDYHEVVVEYGVHWNFFITLALVRIFVSLIGTVIDIRKHHLTLAIMFMIAYQYVLSFCGLERAIIFGLHGDNARVDFVDANREGIFSVLGFMPLYLIGMRLSTMTRKNRQPLKGWLRILVKFVLIFSLTQLATVISHEYLGVLPSRRMCNLTYQFFSLAMGILAGIQLLAIEVLAMLGCALRAPLFSMGENPFDQLMPCMLHAVNRHAGAYFILANVLTGVINMTTMPMLVTDATITLTALFGYMFTLTLTARLLPQSSNAQI